MKNPALFSLLPALLLTLFVLPATAEVPYTPSHVLVSSQHNGSLAYLLLSDHSEKGVQFLSLNISTNVDAANPKYSVLLDKTPFQSNDQSSFIPVIDDRGTIKAYAGNCQNLDNAVIWQFSPNYNSPTGNGTWDRLPVDVPAKAANKNLQGPNFLAGGFAYPSSKTSATSLYTFGGLCPLSNGSTQNWVSAAQYSQSMTVLHPSSPSGHTSYRIATTGHRAPPVAEAGFTMTPLHPTRATTSAGTMLQQQDILLIGGHTREAFINMSELAIFSVPQNSWSFVRVGTEPGPDKTELAVRNALAVEPRSGHSAVLTPDGTKVVIFGGWVSETSVPADPQFAILDIGKGYGGTGPWTWKIPSTPDHGLAKGAGIYGHGATMLPGGVMMIAGGYRISQSPKRSSSGPQPNSQVYLYNVTSNNWVKSYKNPVAHAAEASKPNHGALSSEQKTGLGIGLGLGLPLALGLVLLCWAVARKRRARQRREQHIRKLAHGAERPHFWAAEEQHLANSLRQLQMRQLGSRAPRPDRADPWAGHREYGGYPASRDNGEAMAERTGLLVNAPIPTRNSRQSSGAKFGRFSGQHNGFRRSDTGDIHPIDEREEYETCAAPTQRPDLQCPELSDPTDPFADTPFLTPRSTNLGTIFGIPRDIGRFAPGYGTRVQDGRSSPEKSNRPSSNTSDSSTNSASAKSVHQSRATAFTQPRSLPASGRQSPEKSSSWSTHSKETGHNSVDSATAPVEKCHSADSYSTAPTAQEQRQVEGEHLLADGPETCVPPESPSKRPRTSDWIGSIRRVFTVSQRNPATGAESSFAPMASGIDRRSTVLWPSKRFDSLDKESKPPRRTVSASAELFRRKQRASHWGVGNRVAHETTFRTLRSAGDDFPVGLDGEEQDDWDVEGAAEGRRVQVTFTVPKERLRVVNASDADMDSLSEESISRSSSRRVGRVVSQ